MNTSESSRQTTAVHEAGHAVVAWALGLRVRSLSIGEAGRGKSCIEDPGHLPLSDRIAVAAAGMAAIWPRGMRPGFPTRLRS
jgi:Peptidase M50B-like